MFFVNLGEVRSCFIPALSLPFEQLKPKTFQCLLSATIWQQEIEQPILFGQLR